MFRSVKNWLSGIRGPAAHRCVAPVCRRTRLGLEALEDRQLLSGFGTTLTSAHLPTLSAATAQQGAQVAVNVYQPTQVISLEQATVQSQASPSAALQQNALISDTIQQQSPVEAAGLGQPAQNVLDFNGQQQANYAIQNKVAQLGAYLGKPRAGFEQPHYNGYGAVQEFENGKSILWSPATAASDLAHGLDRTTAGAHLVEGLIRQEYIRVGGTNWGYPTSDAYALPGRPGAFAQYFWDQTSHAGKMIVWTQTEGAHSTQGKIMEKYLSLGGGSYGVPIGPQFNTNGVITQDFRWGGSDGPTATIVWSGQTSTHDVVGPIRDKWISLGTANFGLPTTDSTAFDANGNTLNAVVHFRKFTDSNFWHSGDPHDSAISTTDRGTYFITGEIYTAWYSSGGGLNFGIPTSDEHDADFASFAYGGSDAPYRVSTFRSLDGVAKAIYWNPDPGLGATHFEVDRGDGQGLVQLDFNPKSSPTGSEAVLGATGTALTADPTPQRSYSDSIAASDAIFASLRPAYESNSIAAMDSVWASLQPANEGNLIGSSAVTADVGASLRPAVEGDSMGIDSPMANVVGTQSPPTNVDAPPEITPPADPGAAAGPASQVTDSTNVVIALTDDNGTAHPVQIQSPATQPDVHQSHPRHQSHSHATQSDVNRSHPHHRSHPKATDPAAGHSTVGDRHLHRSV